MKDRLLHEKRMKAGGGIASLSSKCLKASDGDIDLLLFHSVPSTDSFSLADFSKRSLILER